MSSELVLFAPGRTSRPNDREARPEKDNRCPFCPGSESLTPPTLLSLPDGEQDWKVRVFSNLYPLVSADRLSDTYGIHEVIVETPEHNTLFREQSPYQIVLVLQAIRERIKHHSKNDKLLSFIAFRNQGLRGGASLVHPHTQLIGLSWIPPRLSEKLSFFVKQKEKGMCPLCFDSNDSRVLTEYAGFRAFSPKVPRFSRETWIAPVRHEHSYIDINDSELEGMAVLIKKVLQVLSQFYTPFDYNLVLHTKLRNDNSNTFHTHLEVVPRPEAIAGFELGSGMFVNSTKLQQSITELRELFSKDV